MYINPRGRASVDYLASSGVFLIRSQSPTIDHLSFVMAFQGSSWLAATLALFSFFSMLIPANALYFYVDGRQTKCFFEDLPKDTLVAGMKYQFAFPQKLNACHLAAELILSLWMNRQVRHSGRQPQYWYLRRRPQPEGPDHR